MPFDPDDWPEPARSELRAAVHAADSETRMCALKVLTAVDREAASNAATALKADANPFLAAGAEAVLRDDGRFCRDSANKVTRRVALGQIRRARTKSIRW
jgi:hypothetical protein